jgi:hypothetical protein
MKTTDAQPRRHDDELPTEAVYVLQQAKPRKRKATSGGWAYGPGVPCDCGCPDTIGDFGGPECAQCRSLRKAQDRCYTKGYVEERPWVPVLHVLHLDLI